MAAILQDVVALVVCADRTLNAKEALRNRLQGCGAKVATRLGQDVTHVIFERRRGQRASDKATEEADILNFYRKLDALDYPPIVVSPLWVELSISQGRRLVETRFAVGRPKEQLLGPSTRSAGGKKRKQRTLAAPKPAEEFHLDTSGRAFSSSQQINDAGEVGHVADPPAKRQHSRHSTRHTVTPRPEPEPLQQLPALGTATQAVADILALDLPGLDPEVYLEDDTPQGDDLDTPLSLRCARQSLRRHRGPVAAPPGCSRLARGASSGPTRKPNAAPFGGEAGADAQEQAEASPVLEAEAQADEEAEDFPAEQTAGRRASLHPLIVASRFSLRQLQTHPERPVLLHKGTPLPGAVPASTVRKSKPAAAIPIPVVGRVQSPWTAAQALPASQGGSQPAPGTNACGPRPLLPHNSAGGAGTAGSTGGGRGSATPWTLFKTLNRRELPSPWSEPRPWDKRQPKGGAASAQQQQQQGRREALADEAGAQEQEDCWTCDADGAMELGGGHGGSQGQEELQAAQEGHPADRRPNTKRRRRAQNQRLVSQHAQQPSTCTTPPATATAAAAGGSGPTQGFISTTSVGSAVAELCRSAVRRLRGLRMCVEGHEEGAVTHLVIGGVGQRRTLKAMLAVANGAWLVTPEWVTASLEAGRWLPECRYRAAAGTLAAAAERARTQLEVPDAAPPLHELAVHVAAGRGRRGVGDANALRRVAAALGARVVPVKACTLCVMAGAGAARPAGLPRGVTVVRDEWLLQAAERYEVPPLADFKLR